MAPQESLFLSARFATIAHATEDIRKVEQGVAFLTTLVSTAKINLTRQYLKGHHGNMIATISAKLSSGELGSDYLRRISQALTESDKLFLSDGLGGCIDEEGNLYLRFDKQEAYLKRVRLYQGDPIRMKLKFSLTRDPEEIVRVCRESGLVI
jgi:RNA binding exosome subunit